MVNFEVANARISGFSTFLGGLAMIGLILSVNIFTGRVRELTPTLVGAESLSIASFLAAMVLLFSSTVALVSAYTDVGRDLGSSVGLARSFIGAGVVRMFLGVGGLLLVAFGLSLQGVAYAIPAAGAAVAFVILHAKLGGPA